MEDWTIWQIYDVDKNQGYKLLVKKYETSLLSLCFRLNNINAEDLFQDTWVKVFRSLDGFNRDYRFQRWLFTIANNTHKDNCRKTQNLFSKYKDFIDINGKTDETESIRATTYIPEECYETGQNRLQLQSSIKALGECFEMTTMLFYYNDLSVKQISQVLKIPVGTVKSRLHKARILLKEYMEEENYEI